MAVRASGLSTAVWVPWAFVVTGMPLSELFQSLAQCCLEREQLASSIQPSPQGYVSHPARYAVLEHPTFILNLSMVRLSCDVWTILGCLCIFPRSSTDTSNPAGCFFGHRACEVPSSYHSELCAVAPKISFLTHRVIRAYGTNGWIQTLMISTLSIWHVYLFGDY